MVRKKRLKKALMALPQAVRTADETAELELLTSELDTEDNLIDDMVPDSSSILSPKDLYNAIPEDGYVVLAKFSRYSLTQMGIAREGIIFSEVSKTRDVDVRDAAIDILGHLHAYVKDR
ncbi:hypothetical protein B0H67DRAFT_642594 [Lasiosphaeris hirsuta]|uniref:Uncharacterized protein n=1 Tax=Lasiosphaeris hirsuta TaxID=260670 RepID=A0AA40DWR7_9PEZI|nr:hypothetical protein B0H67DRAFT_642594 [Lasiosphaeris hirsuta]